MARDRSGEGDSHDGAILAAIETMRDELRMLAAHVGEGFKTLGAQVDHIERDLCGVDAAMRGDLDGKSPGYRERITTLERDLALARADVAMVRAAIKEDAAARALIRSQERIGERQARVAMWVAGAGLVGALGAAALALLK